MPSTATTIRAVFTADTHLGFDLPAHPRVDRRRRGDDFFANYERVIDYAVLTRPALFVHGGDFFAHSRVPPFVVDRAYEGLRRVADAGIPVVIAPGNHERSKLPASLFLEHPLIHVFDRPRTFALWAGGAAVAVSGFPFVRGDIRGRFPQVVEETGWNDVDADIRLLSFHQAVEGARVGTAGFAFRHGRDVVRMADVPGAFAAVLAGHIHRRQILRADPAADSTPVVYPGSTERTSFAEMHEPKGFFDLAFAPDAAGRWRLARTDFQELPARPMVDIDLTGVPAFDIAAHLRARAERLEVDAVVRLICEDPAPEVVSQLTASFLRSAFPPTVNTQLSMALRRALPGTLDHAGE